MKYEVTWLTYNINEEMECYDYITKASKHDELKAATKEYEKLKSDIDVEEVKLSIVLDEYNRTTEAFKDIKEVENAL